MRRGLLRPETISDLLVSQAARESDVAQALTQELTSKPGQIRALRFLSRLGIKASRLGVSGLVFRGLGVG